MHRPACSLMEHVEESVGVRKRPGNCVRGSLTVPRAGRISTSVLLLVRGLLAVAGRDLPKLVDDRSRACGRAWRVRPRPPFRHVGGLGRGRGVVCPSLGFTATPGFLPITRHAGLEHRRLPVRRESVRGVSRGQVVVSLLRAQPRGLHRVRLRCHSGDVGGPEICASSAGRGDSDRRAGGHGGRCISPSPAHAGGARRRFAAGRPLGLAATPRGGRAAVPAEVKLEKRFPRHLASVLAVQAGEYGLEGGGVSARRSETGKPAPSQGAGRRGARTTASCACAMAPQRAYATAMSSTPTAPRPSESMVRHRAPKVRGGGRRRVVRECCVDFGPMLPVRARVRLVRLSPAVHVASAAARGSHGACMLRHSSAVSRSAARSRETWARRHATSRRRRCRRRGYGALLFGWREPQREAKSSVASSRGGPASSEHMPSSKASRGSAPVWCRSAPSRVSSAVSNHRLPSRSRMDATLPARRRKARWECVFSAAGSSGSAGERYATKSATVTKPSSAGSARVRVCVCVQVSCRTQTPRCAAYQCPCV